MTNADKFKSLFGLYATELWAMPEKDFLKWLNSEVDNCSESPNSSDTIDRQAAIDALKGLPTWWADEGGYYGGAQPPMVALLDPEDAVSAIENLPSAQPEQRWIPFKTRPLTEEEKEEHPEWDCILDCKLPDNEQRILVAIRIRGHEEVQQDEFYSDDGSYLDSGYEIGTEAVAWMPLPEPYKEDDHETD